MSSNEATRLAGVNPDFHTQELFHGISRGDYPSWGLYIQVMDPEQAERHGLAMFDITKIWRHKDFPLIPVGKMTLNKNVSLFPGLIDPCLFDPFEPILINNSRPTTLRKSNKQPFHRPTWFLA